MLILYYLFLKSPLLLLIPYVLQVIPYFFILRKLNYKGLYALIPSYSEFLFTRKVYPKKRTFFNPFILACIMVGFAFYVSPYRGVGIVYLLVAFIVYSLFLVGLYRRLGKAFGKKWSFTLAAIFFTPFALLKLGLDKSQFTQPAFKPKKTYPKPVTILLRVTYAMVSAVMVLAIVAVASFFSIQQRVPRFMVDIWNKDTYDVTSGIVDTGDVVSRNDLLGIRLDEVVENADARDKYFPDHKNDKDVVVFVYVVGSNLEDGRGLASVNIEQMIDATKEGSALKFVLETGGSERWFTRGIKNNSYGRYEIANGKLTKVMDLPGDTNMSTANELAHFMNWGKENYDADRTMLVMWDHGGGVTSGFGKDDVNGGLAQTIPVSGIVKALEAVGVKYDMIGFDACLMQDIEIVKELEPYADYYIASEETESGYGWPFTYAFGSLAKNPGLDTEEFARRLIGCYDPYNTVNSRNQVKTDATLSLVDIPVAAKAYEKLDEMLKNVAEVIVDDSSVFANISVAAENTYKFQGEQIDLIGFLETLDEIDYNGKVYDKQKLADLIDTVKASVIYRNGASAYGINGIAFAFGNHCLNNYVMLNTELQNINCINEKKAFDTYFSIMAAQQRKHKESTSTINDGLANYVTGSLMDATFERQDWYISGFENYDDSEVFVDVPLTPTENGYKVELPENTWNIITDVQTMVYQKVDDVKGADTRYLGNDYLGGVDENGHNLIDSDDNWVHINGQIVCYEADQVKITKAGEVYTGKIKARLNNAKDIYILIEWDPWVDETAPESAHVTGYISADDKVLPDEKGTLELVPGDTIQFLFSYYDEHGNYIDTLPSGKRIRVTKQERLEVLDLPMEPCTIEFGGVLKDIYQRLMTTEMIEYIITK